MMAIAMGSSSATGAEIDAGFSPRDFQQFQQEGFVVARGLASPEVCSRMLDVTRTGLAEHILPVEYEADLHYPGAPASRSESGGDTIRRLKEAHGRDPVFVHWIAGVPISSRLHQLLGAQVVMPLAHHNCIMTKQPRFSSQTGWHQDIRYWSFSRPDLVSVWLALGDETPENGCLYVIPGTHRMDFARARFDEALFLRPDLAENADLIKRRVPVPLARGDVLFFHCRTFHSAGRNETDLTKYSVVFTFRGGDNPPLAGTRSGAFPELLLPTPGS